MSHPDSSQEREARRFTRDVSRLPNAITTLPTVEPVSRTGLSSVVRSFLGGGRPLSEAQRAAFQANWGGDPADVRVHTGQQAAALADRFGARAFTLGPDIVLGEGLSSDQSPEGTKVLAHELTHVAQQQGVMGEQASPGAIYRQTPGEAMVNRADVWLTTNDNLKVEVDVLRAALREIKRGKSVNFNKTAGLMRVTNAATILGRSAAETAALKAEWEWLADNRSAQASAAYRSRETAFWASLLSPLAQLKTSHPGAHTEYWLRNTPPQVVDVIHDVADATLPADQLYTYAASEGLIDVYVRTQLALGKTDMPTKGELSLVMTDLPVSGFSALGLDDFMTDLSASRQPLTGFLPAGFDMTKIAEIRRANEKGREVRSVAADDLKTGLQAMSAMVKRRRALFLEDAKANGYAAPTEDELIYWTYIYYNVGEFEGKEQLEKYRGKRKLSDWITAGEYPNALKVLRSYKMLKAMSLF